MTELQQIAFTNPPPVSIEPVKELLAYPALNRMERIRETIGKVLKHPNLDPGKVSGFMGKLFALVSGVTGSGGEVSISKFLNQLPSYLGARDFQMATAGLALVQSLNLDEGKFDWKNGIGKNWTDDQKARFIKGVSLLMDDKIDGKLDDKAFHRAMHWLVNAIDMVTPDGSPLKPKELEQWEKYKEANPDIAQEINYAGHGRTPEEIAEAIRALLRGAYGHDVMARLREGGFDMSGGGGGHIAGRTNVGGGENDEPSKRLQTYKQIINRTPETGPLTEINEAQDIRDLKEKLQEQYWDIDAEEDFERIAGGGFKTVYEIPNSPNVLVLSTHISTSELLRMEQMSRLGLSPKIDWEKSVFFPSSRYNSGVGVAGIVMERINGRTFVEAMLDETLPPQERIAIARDFMEKMARMHVAGGIFHGDMKGNNVMVEGTKVYPIDFGFSYQHKNNDGELEYDLLYMTEGMAEGMVRGLFSSDLDAFQTLKDWYLSEAEKLINISTTSGRTQESKVRREIFERAKQELERMEQLRIELNQ